MVISLERDADLHMTQLMSCFSEIQIGFTFLVLAHLCSPGKRAVKRVCVCVCWCNKHLAIGLSACCWRLRDRKFLTSLKFDVICCMCVSGCERCVVFAKVVKN